MRMSFLDKSRFYANYILNKTVSIWFEVKYPKLRMFLYEMMYSIPKIFRYESMVPSPFNVTRVETIFGKFEVRPHTVDMSNASPAFERDDIDHITSIINGLLKQGKNVLFLDIGSDIGTFIVSVANRFKGNARFRAIAFEPSESCMILKRNIDLNGLSECCQIINLALYDQAGVELNFSYNPSAPGSSGVTTEGAAHKVMTTTIDETLAGRLDGTDALVIKADVEGLESKVLKGGHSTIKRIKTAHLLVEDFVNPEIIDYLESIGAHFRAKLTPYNSFWEISNN